MSDLKGKTVLVTGGNSGIGLSAARLMAQGGARVAIAGRDPASLEAAAGLIGGDVLTIQVDISKLADIDRMYGVIGDVFSHLDALVANAGISKGTPIDSVTEEQFDELFTINVKGTYFTVQKAIPLLRPGSSIVLNASISALTGVPGFSVYGASKGAIRSLNRLFAGDLAPRGVRVNMVTPGPIHTPIWSRYDIDPAILRAAEEKITRRIPHARMGRDEEVAKAIVFLASDASSYMAGAELIVDGGITNVSAGAPAYREA